MKTKTNPMQKALEALAKHPKCGAQCKQSDGKCKNAAMANGRCRLHGGKSTGRPKTHGQTTKASKALRNEVRKTLDNLRSLRKFNNF
jgi:hypothetical protein